MAYRLTIWRWLADADLSQCLECEATMPRYYFDVRDGRGFHRDEFGDELASIDEAVAQAQSILPDIVRDEMPDGDWHDVSCDVRNDDGHIVYQGELTYRGRRL